MYTSLLKLILLEGPFFFLLLSHQDGYDKLCHNFFWLLCDGYETLRRTTAIIWQ